MKKVLLALFVASVVFAGCKKQEAPMAADQQAAPAADQAAAPAAADQQQAPAAQ